MALSFAMRKKLWRWIRFRPRPRVKSVRSSSQPYRTFTPLSWLPAAALAVFIASLATARAASADFALTSGFASVNGLCLDAAGSQLDVAPCNGGSAQAFSLGAAGELTGLGGLCADILDANAGIIGLRACNGAVSQHWVLRGQHLVGASERCLVTAGGPAQPGGEVGVGQCDRGNDGWTPVNAPTTLETVGGNCLSATNGGATLATAACSGSTAQRFHFTGQGEIAGEDNRCLEADGSSGTMAPCNGGGAQRWTLDGRTLRNRAGLCLDVANGRPMPGTPVRGARCEGSQGQQWLAPAFYSEGMATLLVITDEQMKSAAAPLIAHKNATGMPAALATVEDFTAQFLDCRTDCPPGADIAGAVKRGIDYFYRYRGTKYVFLAGDSTHVPVRYATHHDSPVDTPEKHTISYRATDLYYANIYHHRGGSDLAGAFSSWDANHDGRFNESRWLVSAYDFNPDDVDGYPDVAVGRLDVSKPDDLVKYVQKVVAYETVRMNADGSTFFADELYGGADRYDREIASRLTIRGRTSFYMIEHKAQDALPARFQSGGAADVERAAADSVFIVYVGHGARAQWGHDSAVVSLGVIGKMSQSNLPIVFGIGCETGAYTPDYRKFSAVPPDTPPPPPQPFNAFSNWWLAHAGWQDGRSGGAIAYAGEPLVMPDDLGAELVGDFMQRYSAGERTLGDAWRAAQQMYWHAHLNTRNKPGDNSWPFAEPRIYLGIMTLFGDPSLRLQRDGGPIH